jgi:hypothetical protein
VSGQEGVIEFLSRSAALQQYKQAVLLYHVVVAEGTEKLERDPESVAQDIERMLGGLGGAEVSCATVFPYIPPKIHESRCLPHAHTHPVSLANAHALMFRNGLSTHARVRPHSQAHSLTV